MLFDSKQSLNAEYLMIKVRDRMILKCKSCNPVKLHRRLVITYCACRNNQLIKKASASCRLLQFCNVLNAKFPVW